MRRVKPALVIVLLPLILICCKKSWDDYYARPEGLEGPIYQQLQKEGRFTMFTSCLESTGYSDILGRTGYFTVFAPNDEAFANFLQEKGLSAPDQLDTTIKKLIVQYAIIDNGYTKRQLAAWQSSKGWMYGTAFKRMTRVNRYLTIDSLFSFIPDLNMEVYFNNEGTKYIPYFIDEYFTANNLTTSDYEMFFPNSEFTGFNVLGSSVKGEAILAENGYIYEVDKVNLPLPNIDEYLAGNPEMNNYSLFKNILDRLYDVTFDSITSPSYTLPVFYKEYSGGLYFAPNDENWVVSSGEPNASQTNGWTLFTPDNNAMSKFLSEKLLLHYTSIDEIYNSRIEVLVDLVNSHMFRKIIWPSQLSENSSNFGIIISEQNVLNANVLSNGFLYGLNTVLGSGNVFQSVFGEIYLNPEYTMMYRGINNIDENKSLKNLLTSREIRYTLLLAPDSTFEAEGYTFNNVQDYFEYTGIFGNSNANFSEILFMHIIRGEHTDLTDNGFLETHNNQYVKFENNQVWGGGNMERNIPVNITGSSSISDNGLVFMIDKPVLPPTLTLGEVLGNPPEGANYSMFNLYLGNSGIFIEGLIDGVTEGHPYTILVPTDSAITAAGLPVYNSTLPEDKEVIRKFVQYHIIPEKKIFTDARITGTAKTTLFTGYDGRLKVYEAVVFGGTNNALTITDKTGSEAKVKNTAGSNRMTADNGVILQIDKVLMNE